MDLEINLLLRMFSAVVCGAAIGLERSKRQKEAGIRTHIMVTLGATIIVIVSKYGFLDIVGVPGVNVDVARIAANIITGISFLGAGVIFLKGGYIKGLTTAAGIWTTAGVGCALGTGMYLIGFSATLMILIIQTFLHFFIPSSENMPTVEFSMKLLNGKNAVSDIRAWYKKNGISVMQMSIMKSDDDSFLMDVTVRIPKSITPDKLLSDMDSNKNVLEFSAQMQPW